MVPDSVLNSVVTAASYWGYVDPDQKSTRFAQFGPTRMADPLKGESCRENEGAARRPVHRSCTALTRMPPV